MLPELIYTLQWDLPGLNLPALPDLHFQVHLEDPCQFPSTVQAMTLLSCNRSHTFSLSLTCLSHTRALSPNSEPNVLMLLLLSCLLCSLIPSAIVSTLVLPPSPPTSPYSSPPSASAVVFPLNCHCHHLPSLSVTHLNHCLLSLSTVTVTVAIFCFYYHHHHRHHFNLCCVLHAYCLLFPTANNPSVHVLSLFFLSVYYLGPHLYPMCE